MNGARIVTALLVAILAALLPRGLQAGCQTVHVRHFRNQAIVVNQPYAQSYLYQVGAPLQIEASAEKTADLIWEKLTAKMQAGGQADAVTMPLTVAGDRFSLVRANCVGCHTTNAKASEAFDMTSLETLTCEQRVQMATSVLDGRMPKGKKLAPNVMGDLLGQILGADTAPNAGVAQQWTPPPPKVEQLTVAPAAPEPPKPELPKWKFKVDDWPFYLPGQKKWKVVSRHRMHMESGIVVNHYTIRNEGAEFVEQTVPEISLSWSQHGEETSAPPTPEPNQESEVIP